MTEFEKQKQAIITKPLKIVDETTVYMSAYAVPAFKDDIGFYVVKELEQLQPPAIEIKPLEWEQARDPDGCLEPMDYVMQADTSINLYRAYEDGCCYVVHSDDTYYWYRIPNTATNMEEAKLEVQKYHEKIIRKQIV